MNDLPFRQYLFQIIFSLVVIILLPITKAIIKKIVYKYGHVIQIHEIRIKQVMRVLSLMLNITFLFIVAMIWGVKPDNLILSLSSVLAFVGVALFAQWSVLSNVTAGLIMYFSAPFRIGDRINIIDKDIPITATIENIHSFYTHIRTDDNELIVIPNNVFLQKIVSIKKPE
jgi:Small-conductance mechanosensitive channel